MSDLGWGALAALGALAIVTCVVTLVLIFKMVKKFKLIHQPGMPISTKLAFYGSMIYTVVPFDLLPDPVLLDDIGVLLAALIYVNRTAKKVYGGIHTG
jgi:uncharacterized membrane protein YkvA (DUF1232 family)